MSGQEIYYRPPSEAESFIVRVMRGCPHNRCTFCGMFKGVRCVVLPLEEVLAGLEADAAGLGPLLARGVESVYLEGGDPLRLPAGHLLAIMRRARLLFPAARRFACYATARSIVRKPPEDLAALARAGLERVFVGLESGSDEILRRTRKGCTRADLVRAGEMLGEAGVELDVSMMLGIGGLELSPEHARLTAELINRLSPACVRVRTFVPKTDTELGEDYLAGRFQLPGPHETLRELYRLVYDLESPTRLLSEHWSNFLHFSARMPEGKWELLELIENRLALPEACFRRVGAADQA